MTTRYAKRIPQKLKIMLSFETKLKIKNLGRIAFSDRAIAILSNTTRQGNSLKAPLDAIRKNGLIPKKLLPQVESFDEYYNPASITETMKKIGQEFLKRFVINYEIVYRKDFKKVAQDDGFITGLYAWPEPTDGYYPAVHNFTPNHAIDIWKPEYFAFDNYEESPNDFIKQLSPFYEFLDYGYVIKINREIITPQLPPWWVQLWRRLIK